MSLALYYPFSRCLDTTVLKRSLLLHDEILFVDAVSRGERDALYAREAAIDSDVDASLARRWNAVEPDYRLLEQERIVRTVDPAVLFDVDAAAEEIDQGLEVDLHVNRGRSLFRGRRPWSMLEARLPAGGAHGPLGRWLTDSRRGHWTGVVKVPYAVGSSLSLSIALASAHATGATLLTDSEAHLQLYSRRLRAAASMDAPGLRAIAPSPLTRSLIEFRVVDALAPAEALRRMTMDQVLEYRRQHAAARSELTGWLDKLTEQARSRPWDYAFETELAEIAERARDIAADPGRFGVATQGFKRRLSNGVFVTGALSTLTALVVPGVSDLVAFALGSFSASSVTGGVVDDLRAQRPPERNAVSYLVNARA